MISQKVVFECILGAFLFAAVYGLCKIQLELQMDGETIDPTSAVGQFFWFSKMIIGIVASRYASKELAGLISSITPMVEQHIQKTQVPSSGGQQRPSARVNS